MAKNMTRKSIASSAALALGLAAFVGAPANAEASSISITPLVGTNSNFLADTGMVLAMTAVGAGAAENIEFKVDGAVASDFSSVDFGADTDLDNVDALADFDVNATVATLSAADNTSVITPGGNWTKGEYNVLYLNFDESEVTTVRTITITPFRDDVVNDNKPTANEQVFASYSFTIHPASKLTPTVTISDPGIGNATTANAVVAFPGVNMASIIEAGTLGSVKFVRNGTADTNTFSQAAYSSTLDAYVVASDAFNYAADDVIVATSYILDQATGSASATVTVATSVIDTISANQVASGDDFSDPAVNEAGTSTNDAVRAGSGSFVVFADLVAVAGKSNAGATVTWTIEEQGNNTLSGTISAGGKTLTNSKTSSKQKIEVDVLSNASGRAILELTYSGLKNLDKFTIQGAVEADNELDTTDTVTYTVVNSEFKQAIIDDFYGNAVKSISNGSSQTLRVHLLDNFETPFTTASKVDYRVQDGSSDITGTTSASTSGFVDISWTDNNTADDLDITFDITDVDVLISGVYTSQSYTANNMVALRSYKALDTASRIAISNQSDDTDTALATTARTAVNERTSDGTAQTLSENVRATVYGASGAVLPGVPVTFSSPGLQLGDAANPEITALDSITLYTNASGVVDVYYNSTLAGKKVITATSGAASKSTTAGNVSFVAAGPGTGKSISFAGSDATAVSGGTFKVVATLLDGFGNPVDVDTTDTERVRVTYVGKGITLPSTLPVETTATGQISFSVLLGANDTTDGTVTVTYDLDGDGVLTDLGDLTAVWTVDVNPVAPAPAKKVNAGSFKGYVAVYARGYEGQRLSAKIGKDWVVVDPIVNNQEAGTLFRVVEFTGAGYDIAVRIYIDRVLVDTIALTTK